MFNDADLMTLCAFEEANLEPDDGVAAVIRVLLNRTKLKYSSDGTMAGTVFRHDQFSWTEWAMQGDKYTEVAQSPYQVQTRAMSLLQADEAYRAAWGRIEAIVFKVTTGAYAGGLDYKKITSETVLYYNPKLITPPPEWARPIKLDASIGNHRFYHA